MHGERWRVTIYGVCAVTFMMTMYAFERRDRRFVLGFAVGCILSSGGYGPFRLGLGRSGSSS